MFRTATEILEELFALCRSLWEAFDVDGFAYVGGVVITPFHYMRAPIYATSVSLEQAKAAIRDWSVFNGPRE